MKLKMEGIPWTPDLIQIRLSIELWMLVIKRGKGCIVRSVKIFKNVKTKMETTNTKVPEIFASLEIYKLFFQYREYLNESI